jgi:hypothetical protein
MALLLAHRVIRGDVKKGILYTSLFKITFYLDENKKGERVEREWWGYKRGE